MKLSPLSRVRHDSSGGYSPSASSGSYGGRRGGGAFGTSRR